MSEKTGDAGLEFPINQELLEAATHAREEWRVMRDRLKKIDEHKDAVSDVVYKRVHKDYTAKLKETTDVLLKKKEDIDRELSILKKTREKIGTQLGEHRHKLEEIKFRNTLGEFAEEEYQKLFRVEEDKMTKFETVLNAVDNNISRYESVFADEPEFAVPKSSEEVEDEWAKEAEEAEEVSEEGGHPEAGVNGVPEEGGPDYFGAATDAEITNPAIDTSAVAKKARPKVSSGSRVVIVNGATAGDTYPLKGVVSMGRAESNTIVLRDAKVSRQHAQIQQQGNEFVVIDLNSSNGTFVNGQRVEECVLTDGDEIQIGDFVMQFQA